MLPRSRDARWMVPLGVGAGHLLGSWLGDHTGAAPLDGWQGWAIPLALLGVPLALAAGLRTLADADTVEGRSPAGPFRRLLALQVAVFAGLELAEHLLLGRSPIALVGRPALWLGLLAQAVVALAVAWLLRAVHGAGRWIAARRRRVAAPVPAAGPTGSPSARAPRWLVAAGAFARRGPPPSFVP